MAYPVLYVPAGDVVPVLFATYAGSTGASITLTGLAVTDIEIFKDGSVTQRASDAGYTLLDTDGIDFDGITGIHGFSIDTGDNTDAGFYTVGAWFTVVVSAVTVDSQTVNFIACMFRIMEAETTAGRPLTQTAALSANAITATAINADAITAAKVAADVSAEIADAVWDEDATGHQTGGTFGQAIGDPGADTNTIFKAVVTDATGATVGVDVAAVLDDTGTSGVASVTGNVGGNVTGSVGSVATGGIAAASFAAGAIDAAAIAASAIGASEIANDAITAAKIATGAIDADALAADAVDEILDDTIGDGTLTVRQALRVCVAALAGKLSGAATTTVTIRNTADSADVVVATVDADGNRTAITLTP